MNLTLIRPSTLVIGLLATAGAFAQTAERKAFVLPHVLEAKGSVCAPRDAATGQATGRSSDYYLQIDDKKRLSSPQACDNGATAASPQALRESPTLDSGKHTKTGHVTLLK